MTDADFRLLNVREVGKLVGLAPPSLWQMVREGRFPVPLKLSPRATRWRSDEVEAWIESRPRSRDDIRPRNRVAA